MTLHLALPVHPTKRHPLTGAPLQAVGLRRDGRPVWPVIGASDDPPPAPPTDPPAPPAPPVDPPPPAPTDPPRDLGFPKDTPVAEMKVEEQAAYWKHQSRKHEQTWKGIVGDRKVDDVKNDLTEMERIRQEKLTPSEKAIEEAEQRGRSAATTESLKTAAKAILKAHLEGSGKSEQDIKDLMTPVDVTAFIENGDIDTGRLSEFAKKIAPADTGTGGRRDFGGGRRETHTGSGVSAGQQRYQERHGKKAGS